MLQIVLRPMGINAATLDIPVELYPVDIVAVRHENFTERRAGKRFDDFLNERMQGRNPVNAKFDKDGQTTIVVNAGAGGSMPSCQAMRIWSGDCRLMLRVTNRLWNSPHKTSTHAQRAFEKQRSEESEVGGSEIRGQDIKLKISDELQLVSA